MFSPSKDWTPTERLKVIIMVSSAIQDDIYKGSYGRIGRPNMTSLQHIASESSEVLEESRDSIETLIKESGCGEIIFPWESNLDWKLNEIKRLSA